MMQNNEKNSQEGFQTLLNDFQLALDFLPDKLNEAHLKTLKIS